MKTPHFNIREANSQDAERLHQLHTASVRALCSGHYPAEIIDGWLSNRRPEGYLRGIERGDIFVVERDSKVVGFGEAASGKIIAVYVDPIAGRLGVGSAIMRRALEKARRGWQGPIHLESTLNAKSFYERFGFRVVQRTTVQRNTVAVPVVVMELDCIQPMASTAKAEQGK